MYQIEFLVKNTDSCQLIKLTIFLLSDIIDSFFLHYSFEFDRRSMTRDRWKMTEDRRPRTGHG